MCFIGAGSFHNLEPGDIALLIVHEICHARLMKRGVPDDERIRERVEKVCVRRELALARKFEAKRFEEGYFTKSIERYLDGFPKESYTDQARQTRQGGVALEWLRATKQLNAPKWVRRHPLKRMRASLKKQRAQISLDTTNES